MSSVTSETTPLLLPGTRLDLHESGVDVAGEETGISPPIIQIDDDNSSVPALLKSLLDDSVPVILSYILQNSIQTVSVVIAGRLGPKELSVAAFSLMLAFVTGWCVALGGTTALDTLGSQAFTGSSRRIDLSIHFQRCVFLLWILLIPVFGLWYFVEDVLLLLGQHEDLSKDVQSFLRVLCIGAPGYIGFESMKKYLQCQGIMGASTMVLIVISPINVLLNIGLIHYTSLGVLGSPVALSITYWLCFILLGVYTYNSKVHRENGTWGGLRFREVANFQSCVEFLKLAIPGILMVGTEWAAFEIVALAAGRLGGIPLAAQSVIMTADQIINTIPFGIGVAASTRVGNIVGLRDARGAKRAAHSAAFLSVVVGSIIMCTLISVRNVFGLAFSDDEAVIALVSRVMPLVASFQVADGLAGSCGGVLRGLGQQHLGALFNLVAYYVLALPIGIYLAFYSTIVPGLEGLWVGQVIGLFIVGLGEYYVVWLHTDWEEEILKGIARVNGE